MGRNNKTELQTTLIIGVVLFIIIFILSCCAATLSADIYNNGIHEGCGGHWVYDTAVGHRYTTNFIYQCDKCGMTVELSEKY